MRINLYREELSRIPDVQLVSKTADTGKTYYGVRIFLISPPQLHSTTDDDDRSAVTFWLGSLSQCEQYMWTIARATTDLCIEKGKK